MYDYICAAKLLVDHSLSPALPTVVFCSPTAHNAVYKKTMAYLPLLTNKGSMVLSRLLS